MKKFLSILSLNTTMLSVVSSTIACKKADGINVNLKLEKIFNATATQVNIGVNSSILAETEDQFNNSKIINDYFKNLQFIALSVLNKKENTCFLDTSLIEVSLYRTNDISDPIKDNDDLKKTDIKLTKSIYIGFAIKVQNGKSANNNFKNLLQLVFVDNGELFNMKKTIQQPHCGSKSHEL